MNQIAAKKNSARACRTNLVQSYIGAYPETSQSFSSVVPSPLPVTKTQRKVTLANQTIPGYFNVADAS